jgi:KaiC/GvpD/RAD55 family RecA-like ATPase
MGTAVRLPNELRSFLQLPGPQSMVVRGPPGSGKTTLSLAILEAAGGARVLVTNRVSGVELGREFPWLGDNGSSGIQVVDSTIMAPSLLGIAHQASVMSQTVETDSRERRELTEFLTLPPPVQEAWARLPSDGPSTVVIDSWDALVEHYLGQRASRPDFPLERPELERMLLRWMGRAPSHLILILETDQPTQLDYLVNGVVVTRRELVDDRLERWLLLPKLRGIRVANATYPYTVEGAKFQCIEPLSSYSEVHRGQPDPEPDRIPGFLWPGSKSFADAFGRLPVGGMTLFELQDDVPDYVLQRLITPVKVHVARNGGRVLALPAPALSPDEIWGPMEGSRPAGHLAEVFRVLDVSGALERAIKGQSKDRQNGLISIKSLPQTAPDRDPEDNEVSRWLKSGVVGGQPALVTMYASALEALAATMKMPITPELAAAMPASIRSMLGSTSLHLIAIGRSDALLLRAIRSLATVHIRLVNRQGRVLLYGLKPWTSGFVLTEGANSGPYELLRIV